MILTRPKLSLLCSILFFHGLCEAFRLQPPPTTSSRPSSLLRLAKDNNDGYKFGDITRGMVGKFKKDVNSVTGKDKYKFGDFSRWLVKDGMTSLDEAAKRRVQEFTNKPNYQFGDVTKEIFRKFQKGDYSQEDIWLFLKMVTMIGIKLQPIASVLPIKVVMEMLNVSIAQGVGGKVIGTLSTEVDERMKEWVTGDKKYKVGDMTKQKLTGDKDYQIGDMTKRAFSKFTGKDSYTPGDITKTLMEWSPEENKQKDSPPDFLEMDEEAKNEFEAWDKDYLASKQTDKPAVKPEDFPAWDEKFLAAASDPPSNKPDDKASKKG